MAAYVLYTYTIDRTCALEQLNRMNFLDVGTFIVVFLVRQRQNSLPKALGVELSVIRISHEEPLAHLSNPTHGIQ